MKRLIIIFLIIQISTIGFIYSQESCSSKLKEAEAVFDNGIIEDVPAILDECIKRGFNKDEKIRAYKLIIKAYLFDDKHQEADKFMLELLSLEPEYVLDNKTEPIEFVNLFKSYRTLPLYSIGFFGGLNVSQVSILETYSVGNLNTLNKSFGKLKPGFNFGLIINRSIAKNFEISVEPTFSNYKFEYIEEPFDFAILNCIESNTRIALPISVLYQIGKGKISPYLRIGGNTGLLTNASLKLIRSYNVDSEESIAEIKGSDISIKDNRRQIDFKGVIGAGLKYKISRGKLGLDIRYNLGIMNQVINDTRYTNPELLYKYYYIDNDFLLNNIAVSISYVYLIYKPVKNK